MSWEQLWYGQRGSAAALLLAPLSLVYRLVVAARAALFSLGLLRPTRLAGAQVISVGNLVVGGAGKTPVTILLAQWAQACGRRVAVLSRGYGRRSKRVLSFSGANLPPTDEAGDEPRLIARRCPGVTVWVGADRVASARDAIAAGADFVILDDGFQHRRLARDVDLLVESDEGNGHLLPWGPLREPRSARARATLALGADQRRLVASAVLEGSIEHPLSALRGRRVVALTGIARPERVHATLRELGAELVGAHAYADHHPFTRAELEAARADAASRDALLVTTEKDAERLPEGSAWVLRMSLSLTAGADALAAALGLDPARIP